MAARDAWGVTQPSRPKPPTNRERTPMPYQLDTATHVYFYEHEFYVLSNFSAFRLHWGGLDFDTSEHAYHWEKFEVFTPNDRTKAVQRAIHLARSAHDAFKIAEGHAYLRRPDWDEVKRTIMGRILREKARQHEYVARKLEETETRRLVENSHRDSYWGTGADGNGQNVMGQLWEEIRDEHPWRLYHQPARKARPLAAA